VNRDDGIPAIVLASEHFADLGGFDFRLKLAEPAIEFREHVFACLRPLDQDGQVIDSAAQRSGKRDVLFQTAAPLQQSLGERLILPEVGFGRACLDLPQLLCWSCCLKDAPACRLRALRVPDTGGRVRREREPKETSKRLGPRAKANG